MKGPMSKIPKKNAQKKAANNVPAFTRNDLLFDAAPQEKFDT
jgi:hypothetical protein